MSDDASRKDDSTAASNKPAESADWFDAMLSRRQFGVAAVAASVAVTGLSTAALTGCTKREPATTYKDADAIEFQREEGWNFGAAQDALPLKDAQTTDVTGGDRWKAFNERAGMLSLVAASSAAKEMGSQTLFESLDNQAKGKALSEELQPVFNETMETSYQQGAALAHLLRSQKVDKNTLVVLDLPGPESVAAATGMASLFEPVFYFDNWPHPHGAVPAQQTLGATLYYGPELQDAAALRDADATPIMVLDRNRLNEPDLSSPNAFDNRYGVLMPAQTWVKAQGFERVLYVVPTENDELELDDLNEDFSVFEAAGIPVERLAIEAFQPATEAALVDARSAYAAQQERIANGEAIPADEAVPDLDEERETKSQEYHEQRNYYYGGSPFGSYFFLWYMMSMRPMGYGRMPRTPASGRVRQPKPYKATPRPTSFATRYSGTNLRNVGRQRPTGLGRVTAPVNPSTNRASGAYVGAGAAATMRANSAARASRAARGTRAPAPNRGSRGRGVYRSGG